MLLVLTGRQRLKLKTGVVLIALASFNMVIGN